MKVKFQLELFSADKPFFFISSLSFGLFYSFTYSQPMPKAHIYIYDILYNIQHMYVYHTSLT